MRSIVLTYTLQGKKVEKAKMHHSYTLYTKGRTEVKTYTASKEDKTAATWNFQNRKGFWQNNFFPM